MCTVRSCSASRGRQPAERTLRPGPGDQAAGRLRRRGVGAPESRIRESGGLGRSIPLHPGSGRFQQPMLPGQSAFFILLTSRLYLAAW
jgi:hypothetical protein